MKYRSVKFQHLLPAVLKPSRYIGNELNSFRKEISANTVNFCLAFPDVYEIGFSHLGIKILYTILNEQNDCAADRVYAPFPDFGEKLISENIPLFGIESRVPLKDFDILGFTLQSELTYTNILYILELAQIPVFRKDRQENDPIIIAGGPCAVNPHPLSDFIDAFLIGDGEEAIIEIKDVVKKGKDSSRTERLQELSKIKGLFVPEFSGEKKIEARKYMKFGSLDKTHHNQLIPWQMPTHFRYVAEIMRGCSRGCRFCFAGYFYRPVREKNPKAISSQSQKEIENSGWDEAALTSLSTSDYSCIKELMKDLFKITSENKTSLSLPSLRADTIDTEIISLLSRMRQSGLTIAPEAGSQRLRDIINKNISEEEILKSVKIALQNGWKLIKLYFMIGLPLEDDSDIDAIIELVNKIIDLSHKKLRINITISPFVPKVFTPFQWSKMESRSDLLRKAKRLKGVLSRYRFIKVSYHSVETSILECVLGRGNREVGKLIYSAYRNGAIFDSWREYFDFENWQKAAQSNNIKLDEYLAEIPISENLYWENIDIGISKKFLISEWEKAKQKKTSADCRDGKCIACGVCGNGIIPDFVRNDDFQVETIQKL